MRMDKPIEKIILTEREAKILEKAYEIAMDIRDESETIASNRADALMEALSDLIYDPSDDQNYTIGYEKLDKQKQMIYVAIEI